MSHPLLTKWLHDSMAAMGFGGWYAEVIVDDGSDPGIADRLEAALDVCQWYDEGDGPACGKAEAHPRHHDPRGHTYVPLVKP